MEKVLPWGLGCNRAITMITTTSIELKSWNHRTAGVVFSSALEET
jgi:hypothetical protein